MSDFSGMEQSFALAAMTPERGAHEVPGAIHKSPARQEISVQELSLRSVVTPREFAEVMHLRRQIRLPAHVLADPGFAMLEKKETGRAWSRLFAGGTLPSVH